MKHHRRSWDVTVPVRNTTDDDDATITFAAQPPHAPGPLMFSAVPPGGMPPAEPGPYGTPPPPSGRPPRRHRVWRWVTGIAALVVIAVVAAVIAAVATMPSPKGTTQIGQAPRSHGASSAPASSAPAAPAMHATQIRFVIKGDVPASEFGSVDIEYGSNNHTHDVTLTSLAGKLVYTMPYSPRADYYSADVGWSGPGHASVRIVVLSDTGAPLTVSHGDASATGTYGNGDAAAQAAPNNAAGTSWYDES